MVLYLRQAICLTKRFVSSGGPGKGRFLKIGDVKATIKIAKNPELVPALRISSNQPQVVLHHLKWLLQKDLLHQDVFLLGVPGSIRSTLVLLYLQAVNREFEYLPVTRDTTEADIKQRREIRNGTAIYTDLCAVRAALNGRVLIIDGVEKAERNVLPIINNLLENREMQLDDGRFLMHHEKFDKLAEKYSIEELKKMGLERVSPDFHVIALGLPVPRFAGHSLDPPLRSRFQCRHVIPLPYQAMLSECIEAAQNVPSERVKNLVSLAYAVNSQPDLRLPLVPLDSLLQALRIWNVHPEYSGSDILRLIYPLESVLRSNELTTVREFMSKFKVQDSEISSVAAILECKSYGDNREVKVQHGSRNIELEFKAIGQLVQDDTFIKTKNQDALLADLTIAYSQGDFALLGSKGSGKTRVISYLCRTLGLDTETMVLYQDMNSRELIQRRRMLPTGDTVWEDSQLVSAARQGITCVLDGTERVHWSALESISSLLHHRRLFLPDGSRLVGEEEFMRIQENSKLTKDELEKRGVFCIPSCFRLIFIGDSNNVESKWINDALLSLVPFYTLQPLSVEDQCTIVSKLVPEAKFETILKLVSFVNQLRATHDVGLDGVAISLSLRKLIHIIRRDCLHPGELRSLVEKASLSKFLPSITRTAFNEALAKSNLPTDFVDTAAPNEDFSALRTEHRNVTDETMVPDVVFYENDQHFGVMCDMARDFRLGAHLLLIGNQGVGKNKITDHFLNTINRPRKYIQLHRDTTVESLTVKCSIEDKLVKHEDSVLVKAAREGHVLVIDEADKAPLHVIAILKSLLDSGTLVLGDGRRLQPAHLPATTNSVRLHPDFRIIMLANRPGFPFLGNDLFAVLGDLFSIHTIDNPSPENEMALLTNYGPNVTEDVLTKLIAVFGELRNMADEGTLTYPYSTRELVNIVKHINKFPEDSLTTVVKNVFDFDEYSDSYKSVEEVFRRHGIPLGVDRVEGVVLSEKMSIGPIKNIGRWGPTGEKRGVRQTVTTPLHFEESVSVPVHHLELMKEHMRSNMFTEQECMWRIPLHDANICSDAIFSDKTLIVSTVNPPRIYVIRDLEYTSNAEEVDISSFISPKRRSVKYQPRIRLSPFGDNEILVHEEVSNKALVLNTKKSSIRQLNTNESMLQNIAEYFAPEDEWRMLEGTMPLLFKRRGKSIIVLDPRNGTTTKMEHECDIEQVFALEKEQWILKGKDGEMSILKKEGDFWSISGLPSDEFDVTAMRISSDGSLFIKSPEYYFVKGNVPSDKSTTELLGCPRAASESVVDGRRPYYLSDDNTKKFIDANRNMVVLDGDIVISAKPNWSVPKEALRPDVPLSHVAGFLEAVDVNNKLVQYIPVPSPKYESYHGAWLASMAKTPFIVTPMYDNKLITLDTAGSIRAYEMSASMLAKSFDVWRKMIAGEEENLRMEISRDEADFDFSKLDDPKIGKFDPSNTPHHGGNTWMGGTGGYNTAGLGGVGGPFRLDAGHDVYQMPELAKQQVPDHLLEKAREIAKAEYKKKLKEIEMSEYDADAYNSMWRKVEQLSGRLKGIVEQLEAKRSERLWVRHQTSGDLDDSKLIEGITGEKNIYRRRLDKLPEPGTPQEKPKRLRVVFDVSGSMYRFNGYDKRLQRSLEAALLVMTALEGKEDKVLYDVVGHSGDTPCTQFVMNGNYPKNDKERLNVLKSMLAHTQYCSSGDFTVEGLDVAIQDLDKEEESDEKLVVLVSDANLDRYGIRPRHLTDIMNKTDGVRSFIIFIGSLGEQAESLQRRLPAGKAFVCKNTEELPQIMQNIFSSTLI